jgi:ATP-dependent RNA helicase RhlE
VGVSHAAYPVAAELKLPLLAALLRQPGVRNMLVFTRTKHRANRLADGLVRRGVAAERIHGNRSQAQRTQALAAFKAGACPVLVATDIAARGIDVTGLSHVVNFDVPGLPDDYIHRVGRTARAEAVGDAITLVSPAEEADLRAIERAVGTRIPRVTLPGFDYADRGAHRRHPGSPDGRARPEPRRHCPPGRRAGPRPSARPRALGGTAQPGAVGGARLTRAGGPAPPGPVGGRQGPEPGRHCTAPARTPLLNPAP